MKMLYERQVRTLQCLYMMFPLIQYPIDDSLKVPQRGEESSSGRDNVAFWADLPIHKNPMCTVILTSCDT